MRVDDDFEVVVSDANFKQTFPPYPEALSTSSIQVTTFTLGMPSRTSITSLKLTYTQMISKTNTGGNSPVVIQNLTNPKIITGLTPGALYRITTQAIGPSSQGNILTVFFKMPKDDTSPKIDKQDPNINPGEKIYGKSYLELTGGKIIDNKYTYAYRDFDSVQVPTATLDSDRYTFYPPSPAYHYSFGTAFYFPPLKVYEPQEGGFGFFLSPLVDSGYYITFATSGTASAKSQNAIRIMKVFGKQIKILEDSQRGNAATLDTIFSGGVHTVDIKVKVQSETITITAYIDGFKIEAEDKNVRSEPFNRILPITKKVGLLAASGQVSFDYVYAGSISADQYDDDNTLNPYTGQFKSDYLLTQYGDLVYESNNSQLTEFKFDKNTGYDEFGTVAREIVKRNVTFGSGASLPNSWTIGGNTRVTILSEDANHFGGEAFVLNNTSTTVPLADEGINTFSVWGHTIGFSGDIEYNTEPESEYAVPEPVTFESTWLQNEVDVKRLAEWIQSRIVNKAKIIDMKVFGNPLISIGDIIRVTYPYQEFNGTENIIVTHVDHSYNNGLETKIKGRTL